MQSSEGSPSCNHYYLRLRCKLSRIECTNLQQSNAKMRHCGFSSKPILLYANGDNIRLETEKPYDAEEVSQFKSNALSKSADTVLVSAGSSSYLHNLFQIWQPALSCKNHPCGEEVFHPKTKQTESRPLGSPTANQPRMILDRLPFQVLQF